MGSLDLVNLARIVSLRIFLFPFFVLKKAKNYILWLILLVLI